MFVASVDFCSAVQNVTPVFSLGHLLLPR